MNEKDLVFLYVEDDEKSCRVMEYLLTRDMGYENLSIFTDTANFMKRFLALAARPNIVFLDIHIQPQGGFEILRQIRENESLSDIKVLALTASVMNEEINELRTAGFDGAIAKPLDPELFPQLLKQVLNGQRVWHIS